MTNKTLKTVGIISSALMVMALLVVSGSSALADRGGRRGDGDNRGRGNSRDAQFMMVSSSGMSSMGSNMDSSGAMMMNHSDGMNRGRRVHDEEEENNEGLRARIKFLETLVRQLQDRILVLEQRVGVADVTPPIISAVTVTNITANGADINWMTSEPATSKVFFSTTTPVNLLTAANVANATLVTSHSLHLSSLTANTVFRFVVESRDAANNASISAEHAFTTIP